MSHQNNSNAGNTTKNDHPTTTSSDEITSEAAYNLEKMITYIRQKRTVAFGIHQHLSQIPEIDHSDILIESSTPLMSKRNLDSSENDSAPILKQQRILSNDK